MRSTIFAAGLVGPAMAALGGAQQSTVYSTQLVTITSCAATVTDCPARSTTTSSTVHTLTQSTIYDTEYHTFTSASNTLVSSSSYIVSSTLVSVTPTAPVETHISSNSPVGGTAPPPAGSSIPTYSLTSVSPATTPGWIDAGTCVPNISIRTIYETVTFPCSSATGAGTATPTGGASTSGNSPVGTSVPHNATITSSRPTGVVTAGASTWGASGALAAVAGLVAMLAY